MTIDEPRATGAEGEASGAPAERTWPNGPQPELAERLSTIEAAVAEFNRRSAHREAVIDRLHEENQRLRGGLYRSMLEPVIADLIRLYDSLLREATRLTAEDADPAPGRLLESFADDTLLTLERCGLEEFTARPGEPFDPGRHTAVSVVPVEGEALDNTVAEVVAIGFLERETGRVRRPVRARFHQLRPTDAAAGDRQAEGSAAPSDSDARDSNARDSDARDSDARDSDARDSDAPATPEAL